MSEEALLIGFGVLAGVILIGVILYCWITNRNRIKSREHGSLLSFDSSPSRPKKLSKTKNQNVSFYRNEIPSRPQGAYIETILNTWKGDNVMLEINHNYIQWLFPNRVAGVNKDASILTDEEAKIIRETPLLRSRVKRAFEMMLNFYGMNLTADNKIQLSENHVERLEELNKSGNHNFRRISRILLALKELGHKDLMLPWMKFLANLIYKWKYLDQAQSNFERFWIETLDAAEKMELEQYLKRLTEYELA